MIQGRRKRGRILHSPETIQFIKRLDPNSIQLKFIRGENHGDHQIFLLFSLRGLFNNFREILRVGIKEGHSLTIEYNYFRVQFLVDYNKLFVRKMRGGFTKWATLFSTGDRREVTTLGRSSRDY